MSRNTSDKRQPGRTGAGRTSPPKARPGTIGTGTLVLLVCAVFIMALLMVVSSVRFVANPDPAVKAGPMYVTLALTTGAAMLMLVMALNASFLPFTTRQRAANVHLVMWAMGITGVVTGLLTVGQAASPLVTRLVLAGIAFAFITRQNGRRARARARALASAGQAGPPARQTQVRAGSRQRRGGRKR